MIWCGVIIAFHTRIRRNVHITCSLDYAVPFPAARSPQEPVKITPLRRWRVLIKMKMHIRCWLNSITFTVGFRGYKIWYGIVRLCLLRVSGHVVCRCEHFSSFFLSTSVFFCTVWYLVFPLFFCTENVMHFWYTTCQEQTNYIHCLCVDHCIIYAE